MTTLLTRDEFTRRVAARSSGRCVACSSAGTAAHHIMDRKLFPDGGYYLANGAFLCDGCHWKAETTEMTVEQVRSMAGIEETVLPPGFVLGTRYDKWGNIVREDGLREPGPLSSDTGCRRALAKGGYLGFLIRPEEQ